MELNLITKTQKHQKEILNEFYENFNDTYEKFADTTLIELFDKAAELYPDQIAISHGEYEVNYEMLHMLSNKISYYLQDRGVKQGDLVYLEATREINTIAGILGILKVGATYVPVDPESPEERRKYIITHSKCTFQLYSNMYKEIYRVVPDNPVENIRKCTSSSLAYVIYTSGSTGQPKGVFVTHAAVVNTILDINKKIGINQSDRVLGISSLSFDLSVFDVFGTLAAGAELVQIDTQKDINNLKEILKEKQITIWNSVPALMEMLINNLESYYEKDTLKTILLSGDWIPLSLPEKIRRVFVNAKIISLGGATEASIWSIYHEIENINPAWKSIPYGRPLANQKIYILNFQQELCPIGVRGEIYIGGKGVAEGYYNDLEKSKNSFILHPYFGKLYKTGDFGIMHKEAYIEFLGRKDNQVKINGYRVELEEIELCLEKDVSVKKAIAINDITEKSNTIRAFILPQDNMRSQEYYRKLALEYLPVYMIPSSFTEIDHIPLNVNGKIDKKMLLVENDIKTEKNFEAPQGIMEEEIAHIIEAELKDDRKISRNESLYNIGINSIIMMTIIKKLQDKYKINIVFREFMRINTLVDLVEYINSAKETIDYKSINNMENNYLDSTSTFYNKIETNLYTAKEAALSFEKGDSITYLDLSKKIIILGRKIEKSSTGNIAITLENSVSFIVNLLAALMANRKIIIIPDALSKLEMEKIYKWENCGICLCGFELMCLSNKNQGNAGNEICIYNRNCEGELHINKLNIDRFEEEVHSFLQINHLQKDDNLLLYSSKPSEFLLKGIFFAILSGSSLKIFNSLESVNKQISDANNILLTKPDEYNDIIRNGERKKEKLGKRKYKNEEYRYFWNPTLQWYIKNEMLFIGKKYYKELDSRLFPDLYFALQEGMNKLELEVYLSQKCITSTSIIIEQLISQNIIVNKLLETSDIFSTQINLFTHNYGDYLICNKDAYNTFKKEQLTRTVYEGDYCKFNFKDDFLNLGKRRSVREFAKNAIEMETLAKVLSVFRQFEKEGKKKYYYPSSGGFYAIDLYLYIKESAVEGLSSGIYYYSPIKNGIIKVTDEAITERVYYFKNKDIFKSSAITFFFVYNAKVNMPNYGYMGYYYACLDAGIMVGLLSNVLEYCDLSSCCIGDFNTEEIRKILKLDNNELLLHIVEAGKEKNDSEVDYAIKKQGEKLGSVIVFSEKIEWHDIV